MNIRLATPADAGQLLEIYRPYVENTMITFEYEVPGIMEFAGRIRHTLEHYPYLVAQEGGDILGYAYASAFKERAAYEWSVETSIYVKTASRHQGIGTALYTELEKWLSRQHIYNLCACIAYPNPPGIVFHERMGYSTVAHFHNSGYKSGTWCDIVWMEKRLCPHTVPPRPFISLPELIQNSPL